MPLVAALVTAMAAALVTAMAATQPFCTQMACGIREFGEMGGPRPVAAAGDRLCTQMPAAYAN